MIFNFIFGFLLPWLATLLYVTDRTLLISLVPFSAAVAFIIDEVGITFFWDVYPFKYGVLNKIFLDIGLFAIYPSVLYFAMSRYDWSPMLTIVFGSALLTAIEGILLLFGYGRYRNHWNLVGTYVTYFLGVGMSYLYLRNFI